MFGFRQSSLTFQPPYLFNQLVATVLSLIQGESIVLTSDELSNEKYADFTTVAGLAHEKDGIDHASSSTDTPEERVHARTG